MSVSLKETIPPLRPVRPWESLPDGEVPFSNEFHVIFNSSDRSWMVKLSEDAIDATALCKDQREAIRKAKQMAQARKANLIIHARDGSIEEVRWAEELMDESDEEMTHPPAYIVSEVSESRQIRH